MAAPTDAEKQAIIRFRERIADLNLDEDKNSDMYLIRWLRARECNLDAAEEMLRNALRWRTEKGVDNWREWKIAEEVKEIMAYDFLGFDHDNCPVVVMPAGSWDVKRVAREYGTDQYVDYKIMLNEEFIWSMKGKVTRDGVPVTQTLFIIDIKNASISQTSLDVLELLKADARVYEGCYPEVMKACHMINAPWFFTVFFNILKPFLSQRTFGKMYLYDSNPSKWMPVLKELVPAEILPVCYGGLNTTAKINSFYKKN